MVRKGDLNPLVEFEGRPWFEDMRKLTDEELLRMYNIVAFGKYEFAKSAWYVPLSGDVRCPIMIAKGYEVPKTPEKIIQFQDTAKVLESDYRSFIDAWDYGYITKKDIENAILKILESRSIEILERLK